MNHEGLDRRAFLRRTAAVALSGAALGNGRQVFGQAPAIVTAEGARPSVEHGVTAGDVDGDRAMIWSRTDRPARLVVEYSTDRVVRGHEPRRRSGRARDDATSPRASICPACAPGQRIFYRARFQSLQDLRVWSEPIAGTFTTPPADRGAARRDDRLDGRHGRPGLGHRHRHGRHAALRRDAQGGGRRLRPHRRHDLRRRSLAGGGQAGRRARVAEPRDARKEQGRRDARRVPRQPSLQPARRARPPVQRVAVAVRDLGRPRGAEQLVSHGDPRIGPAPRGEERRAAGGPRPARIPGVHAEPLRSVGPGAHLPRVPFRSARRDLRLRHAQLSRAQLGEPPDRGVGRVRHPRRSAGGVAEAPAPGVHGHVEGHRERHAARARRRGRPAVRSGREPATTVRRSDASWRSPGC